MLIAYLPLLFAIAGALVYALAANPKAAEVGRVALWTGLLVTMLQLAGRTVRVF